MRLSSGKRIGQSGQELATAAIFSFILHVLIFAAAALFYTITPRMHIPPFYQVKLVGQPADLGQMPSTPDSAPVPKQPEKPEPKQRKTAVKAHPKTGRPTMPELVKSKAKPETAEEDIREQQTAPAGPTPGGTGTPGVKADSVAVATPQQEFKFGWYLLRIRDKIGQNWNPPPDAADAKVRVIFSVNRSGWIGVVNLVPELSSGSFGFKQAAIRAIRASNPLPPLPEEFSKQSFEFSVDLTPVQ